MYHNDFIEKKFWEAAISIMEYYGQMIANWESVRSFHSCCKEGLEG